MSPAVKEGMSTLRRRPLAIIGFLMFTTGHLASSAAVLDDAPHLALTWSLSSGVKSGTAGRCLTCLTLSRAVALVREGNHNVRAARINIEMARSDVDMAQALPNPQFSMMVTKTNPHSIDDHVNPSPWIRRGWGGTLQLEQPIERGQKRQLRRHSSEAALLAAQMESDATVIAQLRAMYEAFFTVLKCQLKVQISEGHARSYGQLVQLSEQFVRQRSATAGDLSRLRVEAAMSSNEVHRAASALSQARITLAHLLGIDEQAPTITVDEPWPDRIDVGQDLDILPLVESQPEILSAQATLESARQTAALVRSQRERDLTLIMSYSHDGLDTLNTVGLGVSVPLLTGNDFSGDIRKAEAEVTSAQIALESTRAVIASQLASDLDSLKVAAKLLKPFRQDLIANAEINAGAIDAAYARRDAEVLELIDAHGTLYQARSDALDAEAEYAILLHAWKTRTQVGP